MKRILAFVAALALSVTPILGQSITPQIGGGISQGFDGGIGGGGGAIAFKLTAEGDSITAGLGGTPTYPHVALGQLSGSTIGPGNVPTSGIVPGVGQVSVSNIATSGISAVTIYNNFASRGGASFDPSKKNVFSIMAGTNTSGAGDTTFGQKYWFVRETIRLALNGGYARALVGTITARDDDGGLNWTNFILPFNALVRANFNSDMRCDGLFDFANDSRFSPNTAADNTVNYNTDKLHPVAGVVGSPDTGQRAMGDIFNPPFLAALQGAGSKVFAPATWSSVNNNATINNGYDGSVLLSNGNRTAAVPSGFGNYAVRAFPGARTGQMYWEEDVTGGAGAGIVNDTFAFNNAALPGFDGGGNGVWWGNDGKIYYKAAGTLLASTYISGDNLGWAVDFTNKLFWTRRTRAGVSQPWNNNGSAVPFVSGGIPLPVSLVGIVDRYYPVAGVTTGTDAVLSRFAASELLNAIPTPASTFGP